MPHGNMLVVLVLPVYNTFESGIFFIPWPGFLPVIWRCRANVSLHHCAGRFFFIYVIILRYRHSDRSFRFSFKLINNSRKLLLRDNPIVKLIIKIVRKWDFCLVLAEVAFVSRMTYQSCYHWFFFIV